MANNTDELPMERGSLRLLVYGGTGGSGGFVGYCKGLLGSAAVPSDVEVCFVCAPEFSRELGPLDVTVRTVLHPWMSSRSRLKRLLWHLWLYPRLLINEKVDVEFYPSGVLPLLRRIIPGRTIIATTCHNLLPFDLIEFDRQPTHSGYRDLPGLRKRLMRSLENSSTVIFLSEHSKNVISGQMANNPRFAVIAHGMEADFRLETLRAYDIGQTATILYVSPLFPYKHQLNVVRAVRDVRNVSGLDVRLRLVGGGDPVAVLEFQALIEREGAMSYVSLVGKADRSELQKEYAGADIFIFASSCETFGITLLEAMGFKLPIACSNRSGLIAILRDAGVYFDPEDHLSLARALIKLMASTALRQAYGEKAYDYSRKYTWEKCAAETFRFLSATGGKTAALGTK